MAHSAAQVAKMTNPMMIRNRSLSTNDLAALKNVETHERQEHGVSVEDVEMLKDMFDDVRTYMKLFCATFRFDYRAGPLAVAHASVPLICMCVFVVVRSGMTTLWCWSSPPTTTSSPASTPLC